MTDATETLDWNTPLECLPSLVPGTPPELIDALTSGHTKTFRQLLSRDLVLSVTRRRADPYALLDLLVELVNRGFHPRAVRGFRRGTLQRLLNRPSR